MPKFELYLIADFVLNGWGIQQELILGGEVGKHGGRLLPRCESCQVIA
jgi:hypothetical protein